MTRLRSPSPLNSSTPSSFPLYFLLLGPSFVVLMLFTPETLLGLGVGFGIVFIVLACMWFLLWIGNWFLRRNEKEPSWEDIYWRLSATRGSESWQNAINSDLSYGSFDNSNCEGGSCDGGSCDGGGGGDC